MERNKSSSRRIRDPRGAALTALKYLVLIIGAVIMMFPFIWMLLTSLKTLPEAPDGTYRLYGRDGKFLCLSRAAGGQLTSIKNFFGA